MEAASARESLLESSSQHTNSPTSPNVQLDDSSDTPAVVYSLRDRTWRNRWIRVQDLATENTFWKRANHIFAIYFIVISIALATVIVVDWSQQCSHALKVWTLVQISIQIPLLILNGTIVSRLPPDYVERDIRQQVNLSLRKHYLANKIMLLIYLVWFAVGMGILFSSKDRCRDLAPFLYKICESLMLFQAFCITIAIVIFLFYTVSIWLTLYYNVNIVPDLNVDGSSSRGASERMINSLTVKKFDPSLRIRPEDANCAICLGDYVLGEEIRFLPCLKSHHFHKKCVDQWLSEYNKICPMCKKDIEV
eukprot:TRINITY_DN2502_c0_g1_i1.p1 TRINITY_DN2502_c0_g1~~TRINITY_DN2502_c0_g1_i1.p1  ORF type:complete len:307 (+),score=24.61 TRINITY_DN2502_c0_g1_i1:21-941(+)